MEFGIGLEGIVEGDEERRLSNGFEDLSFGHGVLGGLLLLNDGRFLEHFHGVERPVVVAAPLTHQKHFPVSC